MNHSRIDNSAQSQTYGLLAQLRAITDTKISFLARKGTTTRKRKKWKLCILTLVQSVKEMVVQRPKARHIEVARLWRLLSTEPAKKVKEWVLISSREIEGKFRDIN